MWWVAGVPPRAGGGGAAAAGAPQQGSCAACGTSCVPTRPAPPPTPPLLRSPTPSSPSITACPMRQTPCGCLAAVRRRGGGGGACAASAAALPWLLASAHSAPHQPTPLPLPPLSLSLSPTLPSAPQCASQSVSWGLGGAAGSSEECGSEAAPRAASRALLLRLAAHGASALPPPTHHHCRCGAREHGGSGGLPHQPPRPGCPLHRLLCGTGPLHPLPQAAGGGAGVVVSTRDGGLLRGGSFGWC